MVTGARTRGLPLPVCLCPDDGTKYQDTIYSDRWLEEIGLLAETNAVIDRLRADGLSFRLAS